MNPKERILTIRLLEKLTANPALAEGLIQTRGISQNNGGKHDAR